MPSGVFSIASEIEREIVVVSMLRIRSWRSSGTGRLVLATGPNASESLQLGMTIRLLAGELSGTTVASKMKSMRGADSAALATTIDFVRARDQIEALEELPPTVKARALWVYMGLSKMADPDGAVELLAVDFIPQLELNRASWTTYRNVLTEAGLITSERDGRTRPVRLIAPST